MGMIDYKEAKVHTVNLAYCEITFWKKGAAHQGLKGADQAQVSTSRSGFPSVQYRLPSQQLQLDETVTMLKNSFRRGMHYAKAQLRGWLDGANFED